MKLASHQSNRETIDWKKQTGTSLVQAGKKYLGVSIVALVNRDHGNIRKHSHVAGELVALLSGKPPNLHLREGKERFGRMDITQFTFHRSKIHERNNLTD